MAEVVSASRAHKMALVRRSCNIVNQCSIDLCSMCNSDVSHAKLNVTFARKMLRNFQVNTILAYDVSS